MFNMLHYDVDEEIWAAELLCAKGKKKHVKSHSEKKNKRNDFFCYCPLLEKKKHVLYTHSQLLLSHMHTDILSVLL